MTLTGSADTSLAERLSRLEAITHERDIAVQAMFTAIHDRRIEIIRRLDHDVSDGQKYMTEVINRIDQRYIEAAERSAQDIVHLRDYLNTRLADIELRYQQRFDSQQVALKDALNAAEKAVTAALTAADRAVAKAENSAEKRFESVNEFRATLSDQARDLLPRAEAAARFNGQDNRIDQLAKIVDRNEGKSTGLNAAWTYIIGFVSLIATVVTIAAVILYNKP